MSLPLGANVRRPDLGSSNLHFDNENEESVKNKKKYIIRKKNCLVIFQALLTGQYMHFFLAIHFSLSGIFKKNKIKYRH